MRVIQNNYNPSKNILTKTKVKCCVCDSLLEIEPCDLNKHYDIFTNEVGQPETDYSSWYYTVNCPCCGEDARIEECVPIDKFKNGELYEEDYGTYKITKSL